MREPYQILIFPYRFLQNEIEILIGCRNDNGYWQAISGGGENGENQLETAIRELKEETNLTGVNWVKLDSMCMLPKIYFQGHEKWHNYPFVIPAYSFMVEAVGVTKVSSEHSELKWCSLPEAESILKYDSNKIAVWEIGQRLRSK